MLSGLRTTAAAEVVVCEAKLNAATADRLVADGQVGDALADGGDDAGALDAERHGAGLRPG